MIKVLSILSLAAILIMTPNFAEATLLGDQVNIAGDQLAPFSLLPAPPSATVIDDPNNPEFGYSLCVNPTNGGASVDIGESSVWFSFGSSNACTHDAHTISLSNLDWVNANGIIVGVTQGACDSGTIGAVVVTFGDHNIDFEFDDFTTIAGGVSCHFDIETEHVVGGEFLPIDSTALVLAGLQSSAIWMLPVLAGAAGVGAFYIKTRMSKE